MTPHPLLAKQDSNSLMSWNNPAEMAIRRIYTDLVRNKTLTRVFRPDARSCGGFKGYCPGEKITIRIVQEMGTDHPPAPRAPLFFPEAAAHVQIEAVCVLALGALTPEDFIGAGPDVTSQETVRRHLGLIYNLDPESLGPEATITMITFSYLHS